MTAGQKAFLLVCIVVLVGVPALGTGQSSSQVITGVTFDWSTYLTLAPGSDNWPLTWADDGHQYTSWGDGGGFGGTDDDGRVSLGFARIEGSYPDFRAINVWGGKNPERPATFAGKSTSMLVLNDTPECPGEMAIYAHHSSGGSASAFNWKQLVVSCDGMRSWTELPFSRMNGCNGCPGLPYFLQQGQGHRAAIDEYVYIYWIAIRDENTWEVQRPGTIWLSRVLPTGLADLANYEWVSGFSGNGAPTWGAQADRAPVLEDSDGVMRNSAIYNPGLNRFITVTNHTARNRGNIAIWEAPAPWGPWNLVMKEFGWPNNSTVSSTFAFGNFSPKWLSSDGKECVFVWFRPDAWNSVECEFLVEEHLSPF